MAEIFISYAREDAELARRLAEEEEFLCGLRLRIHPGKSRVYRTVDGITFLGWRVFPSFCVLLV